MRVHAVNGVAGALYVPMLRNVPKHPYDQTLDEDVLAFARRSIAKVKPRISAFVDISRPDPTGQRRHTNDMRFYKPQPFARNVFQSFWTEERAYFGNGHVVGIQSDHRA